MCEVSKIKVRKPKKQKVRYIWNMLNMLIKFLRYGPFYCGEDSTMGLLVDYSESEYKNTAYWNNGIQFVISFANFAIIPK